MTDDPDGTIHIELWSGPPNLLAFSVVDDSHLSSEDLLSLYYRVWKRQFWLTYGCHPNQAPSISSTERPALG